MIEEKNEILLKKYENKFNFTCSIHSFDPKIISDLISQISFNNRISIISTYSLNLLPTDAIFCLFKKRKIPLDTMNNFENVFNKIHQPNKTQFKTFLSNVAINIQKYFSTNPHLIDLFCFRAFPLYFYNFSIKEYIKYGFLFLYDVLNTTNFDIKIQEDLFGKMLSSYFFAYPYLTTTFCNNFFHEYQQSHNFSKSSVYAFSSLVTVFPKDLQNILKILIKKGLLYFISTVIIDNVFFKSLNQQLLYSVYFHKTINEDIKTFEKIEKEYLERLNENQKNIEDILNKLLKTQGPDSPTIPPNELCKITQIECSMTYEELFLLYDIFYKYNPNEDKFTLDELPQEITPNSSFKLSSSLIYQNDEKQSSFPFLFKKEKLNQEIISSQDEELKNYPKEKEIIENYLYYKLNKYSSRPYSDFLGDNKTLDAPNKAIKLIQKIREKNIESKIIDKRLKEQEQNIETINLNLALSYNIEKLKNYSERISEESIIYKILVGGKLTQIIMDQQIFNAYVDDKIIKRCEESFSPEIYPFVFLNLVDLINKSENYQKYIIENDLLKQIVDFIKNMDYNKICNIFLNKFTKNKVIHECIDILKQIEYITKNYDLNFKVSSFSLIFMSLYNVISKIELLIQSYNQNKNINLLKPQVKSCLLYTFLQSPTSIVIDFFIKYSKLIQNQKIKKAFSIIHPDCYEKFDYLIEMFNDDVLNIIPANLASTVQFFINEIHFSQ